MSQLEKYQKIFIAHYGKIASNTLAQSLSETLKKDRTSIKSNRHYDEFILTTGLDKIEQLNHIDSKNSNKNAKFLVITVCRNLIDRIVSMYFQVHGEKSLNLSFDEIIRKIDFSNKIFQKLDNFPSKLVNNCNLGFDLYSISLQDAKYFFKKGEKTDFLLLKYNNIKEWPSIFKTLFNIDLILVNRNLSDDKIYKQLYESVLSDIKKVEFVNKAYKRTNHYAVLNL